MNLVRKQGAEPLVDVFGNQYPNAFVSVTSYHVDNLSKELVLNWKVFKDVDSFNAGLIPIEGYAGTYIWKRDPVPEITIGTDENGESVKSTAMLSFDEIMDSGLLSFGKTITLSTQAQAWVLSQKNHLDNAP